MLEDLHGARFSYVLNLIQKTWGLLQQRSARFRSALGWLIGTVWAGVLLQAAESNPGNVDIVPLIWVGWAFMIATAFGDRNWFELLAALAVG